MSEEQPLHPQDPAEGAEDEIDAPGAQKSGDRETDKGPSAEERSAAHPQEPAEGGEDQVQAPGSERPESNE